MAFYGESLGRLAYLESGLNVGQQRRSKKKKKDGKKPEEYQGLCMKQVAR